MLDYNASDLTAMRLAFEVENNQVRPDMYKLRRISREINDKSQTVIDDAREIRRQINRELMEREAREAWS
jgi:hypothetical protein